MEWDGMELECMRLYKRMHSSSLSDLKKTTEVVESSSKTFTRCSVPENTNQLLSLYLGMKRRMKGLAILVKLETSRFQLLAD